MSETKKRERSLAAVAASEFAAAGKAHEKAVAAEARTKKAHDDATAALAAAATRLADARTALLAVGA